MIASSLWTERFLKLMFYLKPLLLCGQTSQTWAEDCMCLLVTTRLKDQNDDSQMTSLINILPKVAFLDMRAQETLSLPKGDLS